MKRVLTLAAAAVFAFAGQALAKSKTATISLNGHCDVLTLKIDKGAVAGTDDPKCAQGFGAGFIGNVKGFGNAIVAGVQFASQPGVQLVFRVQYPLVTGGSWDLSATSDGVSFSEIESGTYTVSGTADRDVPGTTSIAQDVQRAR
jgi:hypothetical protein